MNRERAKELLPIIQAFAEGKDIQWRNTTGEEWQSTTGNLSFFDNWCYRIKPEPREFWIHKRFSIAYNEEDIGPNPEDDDQFIKVREVIE